MSLRDFETYMNKFLIWNIFIIAFCVGMWIWNPPWELGYLIPLVPFLLTSRVSAGFDGSLRKSVAQTRKLYLVSSPKPFKAKAVLSINIVLLIAIVVFVFIVDGIRPIYLSIGFITLVSILLESWIKPDIKATFASAFD